MSVSVAVNTAPSKNVAILQFLGAVSVAMVLWATGRQWSGSHHT